MIDLMKGPGAPLPDQPAQKLVIRFRSYWTGWDGVYPFATYLVVQTDGRLPQHGNVSGNQILAVGAPLPPTPTYQTWLNLVARKLRCGRCWAALRGANDLHNHNQNTLCGRAA